MLCVERGREEKRGQPWEVSRRGRRRHGRQGAAAPLCCARKKSEKKGTEKGVAARG